MRYSSIGSIRRWAWHLRARLAAISDARRAIPAEDATQAAPFVYELRHSAQRLVEGVGSQWAARDHALRNLCEAAQTLRAQALQRLAAAERQVGALEGAHGTGVDVDNPLGTHLPSWAYGLALLVVTGLEVPLLALSFQVLGLTTVQTGLLAVLCAVLTAFLGHALGSVSRHLRLRSGTLLFGLLLLATGFAISLSVLREESMQLLNSDDITLNPVTAGAALFMISVVSLVVASLLAWGHYQTPAARALARARRTQEAARRVVGRLNGEVQRWANLGRAEKHAARQGVLALECEVLQAMAVYAATNLRWRDGHVLPTALHDDRLPRLQPPPALARDEDPDWTTREED